MHMLFMEVLKLFAGLLNSLVFFALFSPYLSKHSLCVLLC